MTTHEQATPEAELHVSRVSETLQAPDMTKGPSTSTRNSVWDVAASLIGVEKWSDEQIQAINLIALKSILYPSKYTFQEAWNTRHETTPLLLGIMKILLDTEHQRVLFIGNRNGKKAVMALAQKCKYPHQLTFSHNIFDLKKVTIDPHNLIVLHDVQSLQDCLKAEVNRKVIHDTLPSFRMYLELSWC